MFGCGVIGEEEDEHGRYVVELTVATAKCWVGEDAALELADDRGVDEVCGLVGRDMEEDFCDRVFGEHRQRRV